MTDAVGISAPRPTKQLRLRRPDQCRVCSIDLPVGTVAIWDPTARTLTCQGCDGAEVAAGPGASIEAGLPGASALRKHQRLEDAREQRAREKFGGLGATLAKVTGEPASTRVWLQGGNGEVRVGARLEKLLDGTGVRLLHDRRVPGHGQANIDHIAVGASGVTVIDAKTHRGKVRRDWEGGLFTGRRTLLRINGRDQTQLIVGVEKQIGYIRAALAELDIGDEIGLAGALCFPNVDGLPMFGRIEIRGIIVDGPKPVARLAARPGALEPGVVHRIWGHLAKALPSAQSRRGDRASGDHVTIAYVAEDSPARVSVSKQMRSREPADSETCRSPNAGPG